MGSTFYALGVAGSFGFLVYYLKGARSHAEVKAGMHAAAMVIWLFLLTKSMIA